ncbi:MAG: aminoacyl-tRNA hydrolase [Herminiimonas sp.]|nr:aminoacyl-tRNA hydrolase [Herminiimonas sp.]
MATTAPASGIVLDESEVEMTAIRAQGPGGQNVNKVSSAIHLRFDIGASTLPEPVKERLLQLKDQRITGEGVIVIKAQQARSQEKNRADAMRRLQEMIDEAATVATPRKATRPTYGSQRKRLESKASRSQVKAMRGKVSD